MTRGERHAYEEHLTNVVILEERHRDGRRDREAYNPATPPGIPMIAGPAFAGMRADVCRNASRQSWKCRKTDLAGFDTIGTFDIGC